MIIGKVGKDIEIETATKAARACGLSIISQLKKATNSNLDSISKIIKLGGFVNCIDEFKELENEFTIADLYRVERVHYYDNSYNMSYIPKRFEKILNPLIQNNETLEVKSL